MKRIFSVFSILAIALTLLMGLTFTQPAFAEVSEGAKIFNNNCASCHAGGSKRVFEKF
jgi:cytochrome c6